MNDRIKELLLEAEKSVQFLSNSVDSKRQIVMDKFAESIIRECVELCDAAAKENSKAVEKFATNDKMDVAYVAKGAEIQAEKLSKDIKEHLGLE